MGNVSRSTIGTSSWDNVYAILNNDSTIKTTLSASVYSAMPDVYTDATDASGCLPFVIIRPPDVSEEYYALGKNKMYTIDIPIECYARKSETIKALSDAVRNALETGRATTSGYKMFMPKFLNPSNSSQLRNQKKVHIVSFIVEYKYGMENA